MVRGKRNIIKNSWDFKRSGPKYWGSFKVVNTGRHCRAWPHRQGLRADRRTDMAVRHFIWQRVLETPTPPRVLLGSDSQHAILKETTGNRNASSAGTRTTKPSTEARVLRKRRPSKTKTQDLRPGPRFRKRRAQVLVFVVRKRRPC